MPKHANHQYASNAQALAGCHFPVGDEAISKRPELGRLRHDCGQIQECLDRLRRCKCRLLALLVLTAAACLIVSGCRSGKQIKDAEYGSVQSLAKTPSCPGPTATSEIWHTGALRSELIDENLDLQHHSRQPTAAETNPNSSNEERAIAEGKASAIVSIAPEQSGLGLTDLIRFAVEHNPEIAIARKEIEIACAKIPQAASLADPMVDVISWPITSNAQQTAGGRMTAEIMLSQEVPWKGKRESRVGQAAREVNRLQSQKSAIELKVANEVKQAWYDSWLANQKVEISRADLEFLEDLLERAKVLYEGGQIGQQDLLRLQSEIGLNTARLANLDADETQAHAELLRVLNWPPEQQLVFAASICDIDRAVIPERTAALAQATAASPELQTIWAKVQRDQWRVTESRLDYYPDLKFSAGWGGMTTRNALAPTADGVDNLVAGVSFNLPVRVAARDAVLRDSESQVVKGLRDWERFRNQTERDVVQLHTVLMSLRAQLATYQSNVVPQLEDALQITLAAYEVNKSDLSDLINLRRDLLRLRQTELELRARWCQTRADLAMVMAEVDW